MAIDARDAFEQTHSAAQPHDGRFNLNDVAGIIDRVVDVSVMALSGTAPASKTAARAVVSSARA